MLDVLQYIIDNFIGIYIIIFLSLISLYMCINLRYYILKIQIRMQTVSL